MGRKWSEIDPQAPIQWVDQEKYLPYFKSLPPEDRWTNPRLPDEKMIWHWEDRRWWALAEED